MEFKGLNIIQACFVMKGFDMSCKFSLCETICLKYQILFSGKNKKKIIDLLSADFSHSTVSVDIYPVTK